MMVSASCIFVSTVQLVGDGGTPSDAAPLALARSATKTGRLNRRSVPPETRLNRRDWRSERADGTHVSAQRQWRGRVNSSRVAARRTMA